MLHSICIALGSNLGNRTAIIQEATRRLAEYGSGSYTSSALYETVPQGFVSSHSFLNAVVMIETNRSVEEWFRHTQQIEKDLGRTSKSMNGQYRDRPIDIDILLYDQLAGEYAHGQLTIPHPRMHLRRFVLEPLHEIAPHLIHPVLQLSIKSLLGRL